MTSTPQSDERLLKASLLTRTLRRPELGALAGLVVITIFFSIFASNKMFELSGIMNFLTPAAHLGILAIGAALLMIGGEFDLSVGSMVAFAGMVFAASITLLSLPLWLAVLVTLVFAGSIGWINGLIVYRTGLPSFIVTLAFLFILRGLALVGLKAATRVQVAQDKAALLNETLSFDQVVHAVFVEGGGATQQRGLTEKIEPGFWSEIFSGDALEGLFHWLAEAGYTATFKSGLPKITGIPVEIIWFALLSILATLVLVKTPLGNWIFASGGDPEAARKSGVPVNRVKVGLFIFTACCAALVAILTVVDAGSTDAARGKQKEFEAIIAAVIGGCLLTGGYGSAIGAFFGAIIFGMVAIGLTYTKIDQDWYLVFLGVMLLIAVTFNKYVRRYATGEK
ncbi:MAG: ABC transporter permease [Gammaproteobacteria bacterium]|jgi:simple sugar transport system permease protein|nr:ATPase [Acidiferrobacteraceae bacterium]MCP4924838.1 ABC transporter permease [Gammaproteobacteria bacterium]|tara:strand:+ start:289 stop:1476 length:1188 start_codon:yes stop_codon:yes gene_type:complete